MNNLEKAKEIVERGNKLNNIINNLNGNEYFNFCIGNYKEGNVGINNGGGRGIIIQDDELLKDLQELRKEYLIKYKNELHKLNDEPLEEIQEDEKWDKGDLETAKTIYNHLVNLWDYLGIEQSDYETQIKTIDEVSKYYIDDIMKKREKKQ